LAGVSGKIKKMEQATMSIFQRLLEILFPSSAKTEEVPSLLDNLPHVTLPDESGHMPGEHAPPADTGPDVLAPGTTHNIGQTTKSG
jgi:hypothetical protein